MDEWKIKSVLEELGLKDILVECLLNFEATVENYPSEEIPGLGDICTKWIDCLGVELGKPDDRKGLLTCQEGISDNPRILAKVLHEKICSYGITSFESAAMVCDYMSAALKKLRGE